MVQLSLRRKPLALLCAGSTLFAGGMGTPAMAGAPSPAAASDAAPVPVVVVTGSRIEHDSYDFPAAIDVVDATRIGNDTNRRYYEAGTGRQWMAGVSAEYTF